MPVMGGVEATVVIRKKLGLTMPIIALSANAMKEAVADCLQAGMNDFLTKPFEPEDLLYKMITLLHLELLYHV